MLSKSNICQAGVALAGINSVILAGDLIEDVTPPIPQVEKLKLRDQAYIVDNGQKSGFELKSILSFPIERLRGTREVVQLAKCLSHKHVDLSSEAPNPCKSQVWWLVPVIPALEMWRQEDPWGLLSTSQ